MVWANKERLYAWDEGEIVKSQCNFTFGYLNRWNDSMGTSVEEGTVWATVLRKTWMG